MPAKDSKNDVLIEHAPSKATMAALDDRRRQMGAQLKAELDGIRCTETAGGAWSERHPFQQVHASSLHEAGHAVLAVVLGRTLKHLTILRDELGDGSVLRSKSDQTPSDIVEEVFIAFAGCAAADEIYGFTTPGNHDDDAVKQLNEKLPLLLSRITPSDAQKPVRKALKLLHRAVEDIAVALVASGTLSGEDATTLVREYEESETFRFVREELRSHIARLAERKKPVCVLGWGDDGCVDVDEVVNFYGFDDGLYCVRAESATDSRVVLEVIETWLDANDNAQALHLGMHGAMNELRPERADTGARISYRELAGVIKRKLSEDAVPIHVFLGACSSDQAAAIWNEMTDVPISLLIAFSGDEDIEVVREILGKVLQQGDLLRPGEHEVFEPIVYLDQTVAMLQEKYPNIRFFHKSDRGSQLEEIAKGTHNDLRVRLQERGRLEEGDSLSETLRELERRGVWTDEETADSESDIIPETSESRKRTRTPAITLGKPARSKKQRR
jgi:predicted CopG family antitoxin